MKKSFALLAAAALMSATNDPKFRDEVIAESFRKEPVNDWQRKKCKSCKLIKNGCKKKYVQPLNQACSDYQKRK